MKLYTYFQSSASYRVRIALNLKGIAYESIAVNLVKSEQRDAPYATINPQMQVPSLVLENGQILTQSLAIMEYLEETHPTPPLLPADPIARSRARAFSLAIATDISPVGNLKIRKYLTTKLGIAEDVVRTQWLQHWTADGLCALEALLRASPHTGTYCFGDAPGMADCCLIPQLFAARRWGTDLAPYPTILRIADACDAHPAFMKAHPAQQQDAV